ncbi:MULTISPECIES: ferredoxin [unclassified Streptomyces]|uniref:ferredoxin n=1 Tax=unclassified Streptomyces TaxID=2593676 RepID=UPI002E821656|nr:ferredoxin [Streptomyces sp. NBC_00589]WTI35866.1 ferredoxin [Streptomyces sp. NBC_00775]WUB30460.1 ferredoxin [Streptomyces sp. NBC_00589]
MKAATVTATAADPRLDIDWTACQGHGLCAELLPEHIALDEWGYPVFDRGPVPRTALKRARRAAADCPVLALKLTTTQGS